MKELGLRNVRFRHGDGTLGWKSHAPFDGILVAAAPLIVPEALLKQLKVGGRLLVPVGPEGKQELIRFTRQEQRIERAIARAGGLRAAARGHGVNVHARIGLLQHLYTRNSNILR